MNRFALTVAAALVATVTVNTAAAEGMYFSLGLGATKASDQDENRFEVETFGTDTGFIGKIALGRHYGNWRGEIELSHQDNDMDKVRSSGMSVSLRGDQSATSLMANVLYDFTTSNPALTPYIGVGIGASRIDWDGVSTGGPVVIDDDDTVAAAQLMAGLNYAYNKDWQVGVEYRHFRSADFDITNNIGTRGEIDGIRSNSLLLTVGRHF